MYARTFGHVLATLALSAGAAPQPVLAQEAPAPDGHGYLRVAANDSEAMELENATPAAQADIGFVDGEAPSETGGGYDVTGLVGTNDLYRAHARTRHVRIPVATAYAAPLVASEDTCMGSRGAGVQVASFGVSVATTWEDQNCRRLKNARELARLGYREAAVQLLCMDDEVYAAMERAGTPCEGVRRIALDPPPEIEAEPPLISFDDVLFDFDRSTLRPEANAILTPVLEMLQADPEMAIDIEGHTDWIGSDAYNQGLSQRRAQAVVEWLVARGIARQRIGAVGRGESEPVATNQTSGGRQLNRRVEVRRRP